uniref:Polycystic kidney disease protein 1-like 2-like n=1 Tax=Saccoglossus kowalevskii TaxID=10224 RepID=A0ABM0MKZ4_SACKO|nr:PREDICTED: polycystic kidney disease protein 1-like 2-like [Saccoglossus kowalevskii]
MISNCMFFRSDDEKVQTTDKLFTLGPLQFSLKELYVSVVSSLIVLPPSILLVQLFRKSRAKHSLEISPQSQTIKKTSPPKEANLKEEELAAKKYIKSSASTDNLVEKEKWGLFKATKDKKRPLSAFHIVIDDESGNKRGACEDWDSDYGSTADFEFDRGTSSPRRPASPLDSSWNWSSSKRMNDPLMPRSRPSSADSEAKKPDTKKKDGKDAKKPFMLPHWCVYFAWLLMFLSSAGSAFFTVLYSMEWGNEKSIQWLITFFLSFFESLILVQPIKVIFLALFVALIWKKPEELEGDVEDNQLKPDEQWLTDVSAYEGIVPVDDGMEEMESPLSPEEMEKARRKRFKEVKMKGVLKEMFVYGTYIIILLLIAYGARDMKSRYEYLEMDNLFFQTSLMGKIDNGFGSYLEYIRGAVIPSLYADTTYNGDRIHWRQRRYLANHITYRIGPARLRQLRVRPELCDAPPLMDEYVKQCEVDYDVKKTEDRGLYGASWSPINESFTEPDNPYALPWLFATAEELDGVSLYGQIAWYSGGGYTAELGSTIEKAYSMVDYLESTHWMDIRTRAVILELTVYNAQTDLFSMVTLISEFPSVGGGVAMKKIEVIRLYPYGGTFPEFLMACDVIFICYIIFFIVEEVRQIKKEKKKYFKDYWNYLEITIIILALIGISMFIYKIPTRDIAVNSLHVEETGGKRAFLNLQSTAIYEEIYNLVLASLVFCSILKFMKLMRLNHHIALMIGTLGAARRDLANFCIVFGVTFIAFGQSGFLLFSGLLLSYSTFISTIETLLSTLLGAFNYSELVAAQPILGPIFFFTFIMMSMMILLNLFVTAVMLAYSVVQADKSKMSHDYEIVDFIWDNIKEIVGLDSSAQEPEEEPLPPDEDDDAADDNEDESDLSPRSEAALCPDNTTTPRTKSIASLRHKSPKKKKQEHSSKRKRRGRHGRRYQQLIFTTELDKEKNKENDCAWSMGSVVESLENRVDILSDFVSDFDYDDNKKANRPYTGVMNSSYDKVTQKSHVIDSGGGMLVHLPQLKVIPQIVHVASDSNEMSEARDAEAHGHSKKEREQHRRGTKVKRAGTESHGAKRHQGGHLGPWHISGNDVNDDHDRLAPDMWTDHKHIDSRDYVRHKEPDTRAPCGVTDSNEQSIYDAGQQLRIHLPQTRHLPSRLPPLPGRTKPH